MTGWFKLWLGRFLRTRQTGPSEPDKDMVKRAQEDAARAKRLARQSAARLEQLSKADTSSERIS